MCFKNTIILYDKIEIFSSYKESKP